MKKLSIIILLFLSCVEWSCKKKANSKPDYLNTNSYLEKINSQIIPTKGTADEKVADSLLLYAQQLHLWNTRMPTYEEFQPRRFTNTPAQLIENLKSYSPISSSNRVLDKYSFLDEGEVASELSGIKPGSYGLRPLYFTNSDFRIKLVDKNSPAELAGLERGDQIIEVNNRADINFNIGNRPPQFVQDAFSSNGSSITLKVKKANQTTKIVHLTRSQYNLNPILYSTIYTKGNIKIGYLAYEKFIENSETKVKEEIDKFNAAGCTKIIIDLRYNGGGRVSTCLSIGNLLAPIKVNGKIQYQAEYNELMQNDKAKILSNQYIKATDGKFYPMTNFKNIFTKTKNSYRFSKTGTFSPNAIYFLITNETASASEMLINMLKPFTEVHLIGKKTYGKPVGFFPVKVGKYNVYYAMSKITNSIGFGNYFEGMIPDKEALDNIRVNWGAENDDMINAALTHIQTGSFSATARRASIESNATERANEFLIKKTKTDNLFFDLPRM